MWWWGWGVVPWHSPRGWGAEEVSRRSVWVRGERHSHVRGESSGYKVHLINSFLFATFVLEPDLNHSHGQPSVLGQLLPHLSCRFGVLFEAGLEHLKLLGLYGGSRTTSFAVFGQFSFSSLTRNSFTFIIRSSAIHIWSLRLSFHWYFVRNISSVTGVQVKILVCVLGHLRPGRATVSVLNIVNLAEQIASVITPDFVSFSKVCRAVPTGEAMGVK